MNLKRRHGWEVSPPPRSPAPVWPRPARPTIRADVRERFNAVKRRADARVAREDAAILTWLRRHPGRDE